MPNCRPSANFDTTDVLEQFQDKFDTLMDAALALNTSASYKSSLNLYNMFVVEHTITPSWPPALSCIVNFLLHLATDKGLSAATIHTYFAGLSYYVKCGNHIDNTNTFIVKKLPEGMTRSSVNRRLVRLPIRQELLQRIVNVMIFVCKSTYGAALFSAAFSLAFHGLFRVGKITITSSANKSKVLQFNDVEIHSEIVTYLRYSKTDQLGYGCKIRIKPTHTSDCAVHHLKSF